MTDAYTDMHRRKQERIRKRMKNKLHQNIQFFFWKSWNIKPQHINHPSFAKWIRDDIGLGDWPKGEGEQ